MLWSGVGIAAVVVAEFVEGIVEGCAVGMPVKTGRIPRSDHSELEKEKCY